MGRRPLPLPDLQDAVVRLRAPREDDVPAVTAACQDAAIQLFTQVPVPYREEHARQFVERSVREREAGEGLALLVADRESDELLGAVALKEVDLDAGVGEVGYWTAPAARRRGVTTRAVRLLSRWAIAELGLSRVSLQADAENAASQRVAERAGFQREGVLRSVGLRHGRRWDAAVYSLVPEDLERGR